MSRPLIEKHRIEVFSSNYNLYGDLSWRVMETLRILMGAHNVEVYSVDEAFIELSHFSADQLPEIARNIRETVEQWTGIKVSVGIPTWVLANS
jgi:DNA polymerase V